MKTYASIAMLGCLVLMLAACGSREPSPSPDASEVQLPDEPSPPPAPAAPADGPDEGLPPPDEPATGPDLGEPDDPFGLPLDEPDDPGADDSAAAEGESPGIGRAIGAALLKGVAAGAAGDR